MRQPLLALLTVSVLFTMAAPAAAASNLTALGDSISDTRSNASMWPSVLHADDAGVAGEGVSQAYRRLHPDGIYGGWDWPAGRKLHYTRYTVVLLGINDICSDRSARYVEHGLAQIYRRLRQHGSTPIPVSVTPFYHSMCWTPHRQSVWNAVNEWIRHQPHHVQLTPSIAGPETPFAYRAAFGSPDHLRPSAAGSRAIARTISQVVYRLTTPSRSTPPTMLKTTPAAKPVSSKSTPPTVLKTAPAALPASGSAPATAPVPQAPPPAAMPLPSLIAVGDIPGCVQGQQVDPAPYLAHYSATILRVVIDPTHGINGQALPCITTAVKEGFRVELVIQWENNWTPDATLAFLQAQLPAYAAYVWALGLGNEQELEQGDKAATVAQWGAVSAAGGATPGEYSAIWKAVEPWVRSEVPNAILVAGSVSPWYLTWLEQAYADGLPGAQVVAGHPYSDAGAYAFDPADFVAWGRSVGLPVWFDESLYGWDSWGACRTLSELAGAQLAGAWLA